MKAMFFSDLIIMRRSLLQTLGLTAVVAVVIAFSMDTLAVAGAIMAAMVPMLFLFSVAAYDEMNQWESFRLAMPMSRRNVVVGRYASLLLVAVASAALGGLVANIALAVLALALGSPSDPTLLLTRILSDSQVVVWSSAIGGAGVVLLMAAVTLPLIMKMGMTRGARLVPIAVAFFIVLTPMLISGNGPLAPYVPDVLRWLLSDDKAVFMLLLVSAAVELALFGLSALLSMRLYATREL